MNGNIKSTAGGANGNPDADPQDRRSLSGRTYTLRFILAAAFGTLVAVSVGAVLFISVGANFRNTYSLLNERAITLLNGMDQAIRVETGRAEGAVNGLAQMFDDGVYDIDDRKTIDIALRAMLAGEEKIEGLLIVDLQGKAVGLLRDAAAQHRQSATARTDARTRQQLQGRNCQPVGKAGLG